MKSVSWSLGGQAMWPKLKGKGPSGEGLACDSGSLRTDRWCAHQARGAGIDLQQESGQHTVPPPAVWWSPCPADPPAWALWLCPLHFVPH